MDSRSSNGNRLEQLELPLPDLIYILRKSLVQFALRITHRYRGKTTTTGTTQYIIDQLSCEIRHTLMDMYSMNMIIDYVVRRDEDETHHISVKCPKGTTHKYIFKVELTGNGQVDIQLYELRSRWDDL